MDRGRYLEIEQAIIAAGWAYDIGYGQFIDREGRIADREDILGALPGLSRQDLREYERIREGR